MIGFSLKAGGAFGDIRLRQAVALAVDRDSLVKEFPKSLMIPTAQVVAPGVFGYMRDFPRKKRTSMRPEDFSRKPEKGKARASPSGPGVFARGCQGPFRSARTDRCAVQPRDHAMVRVLQEAIGGTIFGGPLQLGCGDGRRLGCARRHFPHSTRRVRQLELPFILEQGR